MKSVVIIAGLASLVVPACLEHKLQGELSPGLCNQLVAHKPAPDVEYKPGVDVKGKPVVEADLNPSPVKIPEKISFDVSVDMAKYLGLQSPQGLEGRASMGTIAYENGVLSFNGEPMDGPAAASLRELCAVKPPQKDASKVKHNKD